ncbi:hypothetical protein MWG58_31670 [Streptomyces sp. WAC00276]|nr:hypothetical protein [Streptomyces sp. WAC00276]
MAFFQMRLQVNFRTGRQREIPDTEPYLFWKDLGRYQINQQLLNALAEQVMMPNACSGRFRSGRILPCWRFCGEIFWETQCQERQQPLPDRVIARRPAGAEYGN